MKRPPSHIFFVSRDDARRLRPGQRLIPFLEDQQLRSFAQGAEKKMCFRRNIDVIAGVECERLSADLRFARASEHVNELSECAGVAASFAGRLERDEQL